MAELPIPFDKGYRSGGDPKSYIAGFLRVCRNWIYDPDDDTRPHKIRGRTVAATALPGGVTAANVDGIAYLQYDSGANRILLQGNDRLFEADASAADLSWTEVKDLKTPAVAYPRAGSFVKTIQDSLDRHIVFSGANGEQPLVRDQDGNWKFLSLRAPTATPTLAAVTTASGEAILRPNANTSGVGVTTSEGVGTKAFPSSGTFVVTNAYDTDVGTFTQQELSDEGLIAHDFNFASGAVASYILTVELQDGTSYNPKLIDPTDIYVALATNTGSGFQVFYSRQIEGIYRRIEVELTNINPSALTVRVMMKFSDAFGTSAALRLHDIRLLKKNTQPNTTILGRNAAAVDSASIQYAVTEYYTTKLTNGKTIFVESAPSPLAVRASDGKTEGIAVDVDVHSAIQLNLPAQVNYPDESRQIPSAKAFLKRRIYRSLNNGVWPNLGFIAEVPIDATIFYDDFSSPSTELGSPGLNVLYVGDAIFPVNNPAPSWLDATNFRGSIVCIPLADPHSIQWSPPGSPDYFPAPHNFSFLTGDRNNAGRGISSIGDTLILFLRNGVYRIRNLPMATGGPEFNPLSQMTLTELSPSEGLAGCPLGYCDFHSQKGHSLIAWISDSGIWATDGSLLSERGIGLVRLTSHLDWDRDVDTARLDEARLTFDPVLQAILFDYYDPEGNLRTLYLHTAAHHWIPSGQDQLVPKISGPHPLSAHSRAVGDDGSTIRHWVLDASTLKVLNERTGTDNAGTQIHSILQSHWTYPTGARKTFQIYAGEVYHGDWGANEVFDAEIQTRRDASGITQSSHKKGLSLAGDRLTPAPFLSGSGQSLRIALSHSGKTTSSGSPVRAIGPCVIEAELVGEIRRE